MNKRTAFAKEQGQNAPMAFMQAYEDANSTVQEIYDHEEAYRVATKLADSLREMAEAAALARARSAAQLHKTEGLSVAGLAVRLGISKARAGQLLRVARGHNDK